MPAASEHRRFKDDLYAQLARVGKALAGPHRIELLELLAQSERTVDSLATEIGMSLANASQHLQALRHAGLVDSRKEGLYVRYRVADDSVVALLQALGLVAERRLADLDRLVREHFSDRDDLEAVGMDELVRRGQSGDVIIVDTRPLHEYEAGHIAGALSLPIDEIEQRLRRLPKQKQYVAYCRGPYCVYADRAVELLAQSGRRARRLIEGFPAWKLAGHPVETGPSSLRRKS